MDKRKQLLSAYRSRTTVCCYSPYYIYVEPTNYCNLSCSHCFSRDLKRPKGYMDKTLFRSVARQCHEMGIGWIYLFFLGEPCLHSELTTLVSIAHKVGLKVRLHINGTRSLPMGCQPDKLFISLNETDFSLIKPHVDFLIKNGQIPFSFQPISGIENVIPERYHQYIAEEKPYCNWHEGEGSDIPCHHPYKSFVVLWNGQCAPCCVDYDGEYLIGDVTKQSLASVWNGTEMQRIRKAPVNICLTCNMQRLPEYE